jgi:chorismate mutase
MPTRGVRGATSVEANTREEIFSKTEELLNVLVKKNGLNLDDIASVIFSVTDDINAAFPAAAARNMGWDFIPLFDCVEIPVKGSLKGVIRALIHVNTEKPQREMSHAYLGRAAELWPDIKN